VCEGGVGERMCKGGGEVVGGRVGEMNKEKGGENGGGSRGRLFW